MDWTALTGDAWERHPLRLDFSGLDLPSEEALFAAVSRCAARPGGLRLFSGHLQATASTFAVPGVLPLAEDATFAPWLDRLNDVGLTGVTAMCDGIAAELPELWSALRPVLDPLVDAIGLPSQGFSVALHVARYTASPFGAQVDPAPSLFFPVSGRQRFRLWSPEVRRSHELDEVLLAVEAALPLSEEIELGPGQGLYRPADTLCLHLADGDAVSVIVSLLAVPRPGRPDPTIDRLAKQLRIALPPADPTEAPVDFLHRGELRGGVTQLPSGWVRAVQGARELLDQNRLRITAELWLAHLSLGGLAARPTPSALDALPRSARLAPDPAFPLVWMGVDEGLLIGTGGRIRVVPDIDRMRDLLEFVSAGPFTVLDVLKRFPGTGRTPGGSERKLAIATVQLLLEELVRTRSLIRVGPR